MSAERKGRSGSGSKKAKSALERQAGGQDGRKGGVLVPVDSWGRLIDQLGNLHQAGQDLAEARERAAKAETEAAFLRERLRDAQARIRELEQEPARNRPVLGNGPRRGPVDGHADHDRTIGRTAGPVPRRPARRPGEGEQSQRNGGRSEPVSDVKFDGLDHEEMVGRSTAWSAVRRSPVEQPCSAGTPAPGGVTYAGYPRRRIPSPPRLAAELRRWWSDLGD
ncbi:MAG: hypothetical protein M0Z87_01140 [Actinomycetota bacterium]|nr:hypothetical protein [Actinomycetota bacterium]